MEHVRFPCYARNKITWTVGNFVPELLQSSQFKDLVSPEFTIAMQPLNKMTKWKLSLFRNKSCLVCFLEWAPSKEWNAFAQYNDLTLSYSIGMQDHTTGEVCNQMKGRFNGIWFRERLGRICSFKDISSESRQIRFLNKKELKIVLRMDLVENVNYPPVAHAMSKQYEKLFNNKNFSDFVLMTSEGTEIPVHKNILSTRSLVFETMMATKMRESYENRATIEDIDGKALLEFLRYIYSGRVEGIDEVAAELLYAATKYDVPDLKPLCVRSLAVKLSDSNFIETLMIADLHNEEKLMFFVIDFIKWNYEELKESNGWTDIPNRLFKTILDTVLKDPHPLTESTIKIASKAPMQSFADPMLLRLASDH